MLKKEKTIPVVTEIHVVREGTSVATETPEPEKKMSTKSKKIATQVEVEEINANQTAVATETPEPENLQAQLAKLVSEATRISMLDPNGAAKLLRAAQNLMKIQGVALQEKTLAKMDVHKKEIVELFEGALEQAREYSEEHNLPAFLVTNGVGYQGPDAEIMNAVKFQWASSSVKPVRISTDHKRSGTLSLNGEILGKFDSATAAAKSRGVSLETTSRGNTVYSVPATKALKNAGFVWTPDAK